MQRNEETNEAKKVSIKVRQRESLRNERILFMKLTSYTGEEEKRKNG